MGPNPLVTLYKLEREIRPTLTRHKTKSLHFTEFDHESTGLEQLGDLRYENCIITSLSFGHTGITTARFASY